MTMPSTRRGFTDHEMLPEIGGGMIHMNGRIYDPNLGRFMTADSHIQAAGYSQSYNRYSYILNNPLGGTDPSGHFFELIAALAPLYGAYQSSGPAAKVATNPGEIFNWYALEHSLPGRAALDKHVFSHDWGQTIGHIAIGVGSIFCGYAAVACAVGGEAHVAGYNAWLAGGDHDDVAEAIITTGALTLISAAGSQVIGGVVPGKTAPIGNILAHAALGCAISSAQGGNCGRGAAIAGGLSAADVLWQFTKDRTDTLKLRACAAQLSVCQADERGVLRTDGTRGVDPNYPQTYQDNLITGTGMAREASGLHMYDPGGMLANKGLRWFVTDVSKLHDWFNSVNYSDMGLYMSRGLSFDTAFQLYSFAGMPIAGALTTLHYIGADPSLMSAALISTRRRQ